MDFYTKISNILTSLNSDAMCYYLEKTRFERETQNMTVPCVNIYPNISGNINFTESLELQNSTKLELVFLSQDEWDNSDYDTITASKGTAQIVNDMRILANSVIYKLRLLPNLTINEYQFTNEIRINSNTMSGVSVSLTVKYKDSLICNYEL